jgi:hypothetical protein
MVLADPRNVVELATLAGNPLLIEKYGKEHMAEFVRNQSGTEMLNALNGVISLWGQSSSACLQDFWEHGPLTLTKEEGRAQGQGYYVSGPMLSVILGAYKMQHPETYNVFKAEFDIQMKEMEAVGTRTRVSTKTLHMFGPAMRVMSPFWFLAKEMPVMPQPGTNYRAFIYLKKEHECLYAQDPGSEVFSCASAALNSCTKEDEQTFNVSSFKKGDSVILDNT